MNRIAFGVEYCGTSYFGWQRQPISPTIQECIEAALSQVANHPVTVHCAGRTDTGVHAIQQVFHIESEVEREMHSWVFGGNVNLPEDISLTWAKPVSQEFHARFSATGRTYRYIILNRVTRPGVMNGMVTWQNKSLDINLMCKASECLIGKHDFTSYRSVSCQAKNPVREIRRLEIKALNNLIIIEIEANAFLQHMVRNIAGVLMMIGMGKESVHWAKQVLDACDRTAGGVTAEPDGLYLLSIDYPDHYEIPAADLSSFSFLHQ